MTVPTTKVLIVGAGPSGQLLGLLLAQQGIPVTIIEKASKLDDSPRATHYGPPAVKILNQAGVGQEVRAKGFLPDGVAWRRLDGTYIAGISHDTQKNDPNRMIALPLNQLGQILHEHTTALPSVKYLFNHSVTNIGQDESNAWVDAKDGDTDQVVRLEAEYVVGCDGASSVIRRSLLGEWEFPGRTWDEQIVATNVYYDFDKFGFSDSNFIIDPTHWYMAAKITKDGMWRVTYGETPGLTRDEILSRQANKFRAMLPGNPEKEDYNLVSISPYRVHQRLAKELRVGRFLLAADAAHLCNPFGGLGLTGGIADVGGLYECLIGLFTGRADSSILDIYSQVRRTKYQEIVDPISTENLYRMFKIHPDEVLEKDEFLKMCKRAEKDRELASKMLQSAHGLAYDFTQHYSQ